MKHLKRKNGFTLVELVVGIAAASLVLAAASSLLMMGARIQRTLRDEAQEQQTIRIVLTMLENLAADGTIDSISTTQNGWQLKDKSDKSILTYEEGELKNGNNVLLGGLKTAHADLDGNLFTFDFETAKNRYATSVYCRLIQNVNEATSENIKPIKDKFKPETPGDVIEGGLGSTARYAFLNTLCEEYGSTGRISGEGQYYSQWYNASWSSSTPWCACFLSWAAAKNAASLSSVPKFANVNTGVSDFESGICGTWKNSSYSPIPGDYIFFDWECDDDPDHVGAVLFVYKDTTVNPENTTVYTIEGNSGGRVAIHSYNINDPRIYGYGVLNWKTSAGT